MGLRLLWFIKCQWKHVYGRCCVHLCWRKSGHCWVRNSFKYLRTEGELGCDICSSVISNHLYYIFQDICKQLRSDLRVVVRFLCLSRNGLVFRRHFDHVNKETAAHPAMRTYQNKPVIGLDLPRDNEDWSLFSRGNPSGCSRCADCTKLKTLETTRIWFSLYGTFKEYYKKGLRQNVSQCFYSFIEYLLLKYIGWSTPMKWNVYGTLFDWHAFHDMCTNHKVIECTCKSYTI